MIHFHVPGAPIAAGSKRAFPVPGRDGRMHANVTDASGPRGREWRAAIRHAAAAAIGEIGYGRSPGPLAGPLALCLTFLVRRPRGHCGARGLRPSAPRYPATRPDVLKLARAVEDACTGILWRDDAQIVVEELRKVYAEAGAPIGVHVCLEELAGRHLELEDRRHA